jgi:hypothetical protein
MKDESPQAGPDNQDEPLDTDAVSGEEPGSALQVEMPESASANNAADEQSGQEVTDEADVDGSPRVTDGQAIYRHESSRRRRSPSSWKRQLERAMRTIRYQRIALAGLLGVIALIVLVAVGIRDRAGNKVRNVEHELNQKDIEIVKLRAAVEEQQASIESFVSGRLPGLTKLKLDWVFEVDHPYVRNIIFANVRTDKSNAYEFRIVLENNSSSIGISTPVINVILFDQLGLETDRRKLGYGTGTNMIAIEPLRQGDVRSYVDSFIVRGDAKPAYFLVR